MRRLVLCVVVVLVGVGHVEGAINLTHRYAFDGDASDSAGTNHGTLSNGASIVFDSQRGGVLQLDGVDDFVKLGWSNVPGGPADTSTFTIAAWVKTPPGDPGYQNGAIYMEATSFFDPDTGYPGGNKNYFGVWGLKDNDYDRLGKLLIDQTPGGQHFNSESVVNDSEWHHVAYVQNEGIGPNCKFYIDGVLDVSYAGTIHYSGLAPDLWGIGGFGMTLGVPHYLKGHLDDVRFYDGALTANEVAALAPVPEPSTLAIWSLLALCGYGWRRRRKA